MKKTFTFLICIILFCLLFMSRHILAIDLYEQDQKEEIVDDIDHSKQLEDDTDIDSILVTVDKTKVLNVEDFKNIK